MDYLKNKLFHFIINEYNYSNEYGSNQYDLLRKLGVIFRDDKFIDLAINKLQILTNEDITDITNIFFANNVPVIKTHNDKSSVAAEYEKIIQFIKRNKVTFLPIGFSGHAMSFIIINEDNYYKIYFHNSGLGTERHNIKVDYTIKADSIIMKTIDEVLMKYFIHFLIMTDDIDNLYDNVLGLLENNSIYVKKYENIELTNELQSDSTYFEIQKVGNCSYRSIILAIHTYLILIKKRQPIVMNELLVLLKVYVTNKFFSDLTDYNLLFNNNQLKTLYQYCKDLYNDKKNTYFTDNQEFMQILKQIDNQITKIDDNLNLLEYNAQSFTKLLNNPMIAKLQLNQELPLDTNINNNKIKVNASFEEYLNNTIYQFPIYKKYDGFNLCKRLIGTNEIDNILDNYYDLDSVFSSSRVAIFYDIWSAVTYIKDKLNLNEKETLDPDLLILICFINKYLKSICENININKIVDYDYLNSKLMNLKVNNFNRYKLFDDSLKLLFNKEGLYFNYVLNQSDILLYKLYEILKIKSLPKEINTKFIEESIDHDKITGFYVSDYTDIVKKFAVCTLNILFNTPFGISSHNNSPTITLSEILNFKVNYDEEQFDKLLKIAQKDQDHEKQRQIKAHQLMCSIDIYTYLIKSFKKAFNGYNDVEISELLDNVPIKYDKTGGEIFNYDLLDQLFVSFYDGNNQELCYNGHGVITSISILEGLFNFTKKFDQVKTYHPKLIKTDYVDDPNQTGGVRGKKDNKSKKGTTQKVINILNDRIRKSGQQGIDPVNLIFNFFLQKSNATQFISEEGDLNNLEINRDLKTFVIQIVNEILNNNITNIKDATNEYNKLSKTETVKSLETKTNVELETEPEKIFDLKIKPFLEKNLTNILVNKKIDAKFIDDVITQILEYLNVLFDPETNISDIINNISNKQIRLSNSKYNVLYSNGKLNLSNKSKMSQEFKDGKQSIVNLFNSNKCNIL